MTARELSCALLAAIPFAFGGSALAQHFAGQPVTVIVNFSAGGPTDVEARVIARHLPKYVQGVTSVIIRNVGGGGGNIGVNQLGEATGKERLNLGYFTWNPLNQVIRDETLRVRYNDFKLIAGLRATSLIYMRRDAPPGIRRPADVAKAHIFKAGAMGPAGHATIRQRLALDLLGAKYELIPGYKGLRDIDVAMLQGDIQLSNNSLPGYFTSAKPNLIDKGIAIPVLQYDRADGLPGRSPDLPDVPTFLEVYKEIWGADAMPSGEKWQALQWLTRILDAMARSVFMPPAAPEAAAEEMRSAFDKLAKDAEFAADYEKVAKFKPSFSMGADGERAITALGAIDPALVRFFSRYVESR